METGKESQRKSKIHKLIINRPRDYWEIAGILNFGTLLTRAKLYWFFWYN